VIPLPRSSAPLRASRGRPCTRAARGFTLVEVLVIVVIVGLLAAGIVLSVGTTGRDRELEREGERLAALMNYVREQAELQTREFGLQVREDGYQFTRFDPRLDTWAEPPDDDVLRERKLPGGVRAQLTVEGRPVVLRRRPDPNDRTPHVMILSNGDFTAFELTLARDGTREALRLSPDDSGHVRVEAPLS
jgi:general secretion pathway protein H